MKIAVLLSGAVIVVVVVYGGYLHITKSTASGKSNTTATFNTVPAATETTDQYAALAYTQSDYTSLKRDELLSTYYSRPDAQQITLTDVTGASSTATAYRVVVDNQLYHTIIAHLPDISEDEMYIGWLVNPVTNDSLAAGYFNKVPDGTYVMHIGEDDVEFMGYTDVIVTHQKHSNDTPNNYILKGSFH